MGSGSQRRERAPCFRRGDMVEVRSMNEILATLDSRGKFEGLPFMPEMAKYCGRRFRVRRRAERIYLDRLYVAQMKGAVLLEGVRCDGASHGGCQMSCLTFWKEAWLKRVDSLNATECTEVDTCSPGDYSLPTAEGDRFCCQASELVKATSRLPWWHVGQYVRDFALREMTATQLVRMYFLLAYNKLRKLLGLQAHGTISGRQRKASGGGLGLKPGEIVEVRSKEEIEATLDERSRTRGLGFAPEMVACCGGRYRVAARVERIVLEWSGKMQPLSDTVILEGVTCSGTAYRGCPRGCYQLWRESWLKRVK